MILRKKALESNNTAELNNILILLEHQIKDLTKEIDLPVGSMLQ